MSDEASDVLIRRVAEHGRAMTMLVGDGVLPSNEGRGYVLRRIIRRAILAARRSGSDSSLMAALVDATIEKMGAAYPTLVERARPDRRDPRARGGRLRAHPAHGPVAARGGARGRRTAWGRPSFLVTSRFNFTTRTGFPIELTSEIVAESGLGVDRETFERGDDRAARTSARQRQDPAHCRRRAVPRAHRHATARPSSSVATSRATHWRRPWSASSPVEDGESELFLDATPFYAESGGQVGDVGDRRDRDRTLRGARHPERRGRTLRAPRTLARRDPTRARARSATIDAERREATRRNHTATHLLHAGLRSVLGDHVRQQGSYVGPDRLRFDFSHGGGLSREETGEILTLANTDVVLNEHVDTIQTTKAEAETMGAVAFFGDKYGDRVRVVRAGRHSLEFCGGTHVDRLGDIGQIQIVSESSIGANTRRIEAVSGLGAYRRSFEMEQTLGVGRRAA